MKGHYLPGSSTVGGTVVDDVVNQRGKHRHWSYRLSVEEVGDNKYTAMITIQSNTQQYVKLDVG